MSKRVYISADYGEDDGDRAVVSELTKWGEDNYHKVDFVDMAQVASGSVAKDPDCRICDLKREFNAQINASSAVIFVVGDKTAKRAAGSGCSRMGADEQYQCKCTPYKQNSGGQKDCKVSSTCPSDPRGDVGYINSYSYLQHEFEQAKKRDKTIVVVYNSLRAETGWLPSYMKGYENLATPFWKKSASGNRVGDYSFIKNALGF